MRKPVILKCSPAQSPDLLLASWPPARLPHQCHHTSRPRVHPIRRRLRQRLSVQPPCHHHHTPGNGKLLLSARRPWTFLPSIVLHQPEVGCPPVVPPLPQALRVLLPLLPGLPSLCCPRTPVHRCLGQLTPWQGGLLAPASCLRCAPSPPTAKAQEALGYGLQGRAVTELDTAL